MGNFCTNLRVANEVVSDVLRAKYFVDIILFESKLNQNQILDDLHDLRKAQQLGVHAMPKYDPDKWIEQLLQCQHLPEQDMKVLCDRVRAILIEESNIQPVSAPVTICGDIHGQFWDLLELLRKGGMVPDTSYIFMARMCCVWASIVVYSQSRGGDMAAG